MSCRGTPRPWRTSCLARALRTNLSAWATTRPCCCGTAGALTACAASQQLVHLPTGTGRCRRLACTARTCWHSLSCWPGNGAEAPTLLLEAANVCLTSSAAAKGRQLSAAAHAGLAPRLPRASQPRTAPTTCTPWTGAARTRTSLPQVLASACMPPSGPPRRHAASAPSAPWHACVLLCRRHRKTSSSSGCTGRLMQALSCSPAVRACSAALRGLGTAPDCAAALQVPLTAASRCGTGGNLGQAAARLLRCSRCPCTRRPSCALSSCPQRQVPAALGWIPIRP